MKKLFLFAFLAAGAQVVNAQLINTGATRVEVVAADNRSTTLKFTPGITTMSPVVTPHGTEFVAGVDKGTPILRAGAPDLAKLTESVIIPDAGNTNMVMVSARYHDVANVLIAPSKGNFTRDIDPATVPFTYGEEYTKNAFYPAMEAELRAPYCVRDYRGQTIVVYPFRYNAVTKTLRVYEEIVVRIESVAGIGINELNRAPKPLTAEFDNIYRRQFINYDVEGQNRYTPLAEQGEMLIISHANFMSGMAPFIRWKEKSGIKCTMVNVATIGNNDNAIKAYINNFYNNNNLTFVLLVGDNAEVTASVTSAGPSDQNYSFLVGNDHYSDLLIGRFSVSNTTDLNTVIKRTLEYEMNPLISNYYETCVGIASNQGPGDDNEMDYEHEQNIGALLMAYNYNTFIELYDGSQGGGDANGDPTAAMCATAINDGCGIINYTGHGSSTSIVTTGFNNNDVDALTNTHKWPMVIIVGCVTGDFTNQTCFAEKFLRAKHPVTGEPTGSIANFMSTINQSWSPPMEGQDEMNAILAESYSTNLKRTFGGICANGCMSMNDAYGSGGNDMTDTWTLFGDPSVMYRTAVPQTMTATHPSTTPLGSVQFTVSCSQNDALVTLYQNGSILGSGLVSGGSVTINFPAITTLDTLFVTATKYNFVPYRGYALVIPASGPYVINSAHLLTDPSGNNDNVGDFSENVGFDVTLNNAGLSVANGVSATLSTSDPYVTITDANESFGNIASTTTQSQVNAYAATIANNVPDMHVATFTLNISDNASNNWTSTFTETFHAPVMTCGNASVNDAAGNNNGVIDPSETFNLVIPTGNNGHSTSPACIGTLTSGSPFVTINNNNLALGTVVVNGTVNAVFSVTCSGAAAIGTTLDFNYTATAGAYSASTTYYERVSIAMEDYETNDFTHYPWVVGGNAPWFTTTDNAYDDTYCSKSGAIGNSQTSTMSITLNVLQNDSISFYRATSTEQGYDFLKFYIDGIVRQQWSGVNGWQRFAYAVTPGQHTFRWEYAKDQVYADNQDCCWIDNVTFPAFSNSTGIAEAQVATGFTVYPNPSNGPLSIVYTLAAQADVSLFVTDAQGRMVQAVQQTTQQQAGEQRATLNTTGLARGIYFVNLNINGQNTVQRIVVQ